MGDGSAWAVEGGWGLRGEGPDHPALAQVQTFHGDLLQHMEKNTKLDMQFIKVSLAPPRPCPSGRDPPPAGQVAP